MKLQCCFCKHIVWNVEYDGMLDCELALEEEGNRDVLISLKNLNWKLMKRFVHAI